MIIWNVDKYILQKEENELVLELTRCTQFLKIAKASKFTNEYHIEVESNAVRMANLCLENGVLMYSFMYPPRMLSIKRHNNSASSLTIFFCDASIY